MANHPNRSRFHRIAKEAREFATCGGRLHENAFLDRCNDLLAEHGLRLGTSYPDGADLWTLDAMTKWLRSNAQPA